MPDEEAQRLQHQARLDNDVRAAYEMALLLLADEDAAESEPPGTRWLYLTDLRAELDQQARHAGRELHSREEVDAALQRLTRDEASTVHVIPEDHDHLLDDAGREAAVRFGGAERHMIRIDYPDHDQPAPGDSHRTQSQVDEDGSASDDRPADTAAEAAAGDRAKSGSPPADDSHTDKSEQQADKQSDEDSSSIKDDPGVSELTQDADAMPADEKTAEAEPVAVTETTACAIAVTRAHCAIDRAHQQLDIVEQEAANERDDELARWHADDTAAQVENEQAVNDSAAQGSATVRGE